MRHEHHAFMGGIELIKRKNLRLTQWSLSTIKHEELNQKNPGFTPG